MALTKPMEITFPLPANGAAVLTIKMGQPGTAASHLVDVPGSNDKLTHDNCTEDLAAIANPDLKSDRTIIITKAVNISPNVQSIDIVYSINNTTIFTYSKLKTDDPAPQIILTVKFV